MKYCHNCYLPLQGKPKICKVCKAELWMDDLFGEPIFIPDYLENIEQETNNSLDKNENSDKIR